MDKYICVSLYQITNKMTIKGATILIEQLREEIEQGIEVEFNTQWIALLQKAIVNSLKFNK